MKFESDSRGSDPRSSNSQSASARQRRPAADNEHRSFRSLVLGWTDPDSGDRLTARVRGGEELLPELERAGFEVLAREEETPAPAAGVSVVSQLIERTRGHASRRN